MKAANLPAFNIWKHKNHRYLCCFAKMAFNKLHFSMCMVTRGHFIIITFSLGGSWRGGKSKDAGGSRSPALAPLWPKC